jgi:hypothetical protein
MVSGAILAAGLLLGAALCALHVDLPTGLLLLMILLIFWSDRSRKRAEFTADGTSFSAGTPVQGYIVSAAWVAYALAKAGTPLSGLALTYQPVAAVYSVFAGLYAALAVVFALVAAPEGVVLRRFVGYRLTPWDALPPDPAAPSRRAIRIITMDVDQRFATDSIEYYRTHPEHRAAIGTPAEHERLSQALLEGQAAAPAPAES